MDLSSTIRARRGRPPSTAVLVGLAAAVAVVLSANAVVLVAGTEDRAATGASVLGQVVTAPTSTAGARTVHAGAGVPVDVHLPAGAGPHPVVLYVHGGGWTSGDRAEVPDELGILDVVDEGWAVVSTGYRPADAATGVTAREQATDVATALGWVRSHGRALSLDDRVVAVGHSAGAHLVALVAATAPPAVRPDAVLLVSGVYDFGPDVVRNPMLGPGVEAALGCAGDCASRPSVEPATYADPDDPRVAIVHGSADGIVTPATAERYGRALALADVAVDVHLVPQGEHIGARLGSAARAVLAALTSGSAAGRS